jgi:hypothetical protein
VVLRAVLPVLPAVAREARLLRVAREGCRVAGCRMAPAERNRAPQGLRDKRPKARGALRALRAACPKVPQGLRDKRLKARGVLRALRAACPKVPQVRRDKCPRVKGVLPALRVECPVAVACRE